MHKTSPNDSAMPNQEYDGLTKREYISALTLQALLSRSDIDFINVARDAVSYSDKLIHALNEPSNG